MNIFIIYFKFNYFVSLKIWDNSYCFILDYSVGNPFRCLIYLELEVGELGFFSDNSYYYYYYSYSCIGFYTSCNCRS